MAASGAASTLLDDIGLTAAFTVKVDLRRLQGDCGGDQQPDGRQHVPIKKISRQEW
jgi:hypothetical protein